MINGFEHKPHKIPGMGAGFVPHILDRSVFEEALRVKSPDAMAMAKRLAREEGLLVGISSGANVCAAIEVCTKEGSIELQHIFSWHTVLKTPES